VVVCDGEQAEAAAALLFAGAGGCLFVEDAGAAEVVAATREVAAGHAALHPAAAAAVLRQWRATHASVGPAREAKLSAREIEVLRAMAEGLPTKSVARALGVSPKTVEAHTARILARLGARNRAQAIAVAAEQGLLDIDSCAATGADR
jgi:DNA-binding NarL/FixJ family response regulator